MIKDGFYPKAKALRSVFKARFANPKHTHDERFVWDYWHVPDQYTLVRTPAYNYFSQKMYLEFHKYLVLWGRENLGCWDISPPWMSYYLDGCEQHLHSDVPHGPWAFVFSLSPWSGKNKSYQGGETMILKPSVLSYWNQFSAIQNRERKSFVDLIDSPFNRLTVFDPRFPHGVTRVSGVQDPMEARLVIHGWFTEPKTYIVGSLNKKKAEDKP